VISLSAGVGPDSRSAAGHLTTAVRLAPRRRFGAGRWVAVVMAQRDNASRRVQRAMESCRRASTALDSPLHRLMGLSPPAKLDFSNPETHATVAHIALSVGPEALDFELLHKTFSAFSLDMNDPFAWRKLVWYFAHAHFGAKKKAGRRKTWNAERWCVLLADFEDKKAAGVRKLHRRRHPARG
jgi:hypothetical protein